MLSLWLVLLSIIPYGSVHVKNGKISLFLWLNSTPLYIYHVIFIHWSLDRHLGYFYILAIVNSATMNIVVHVSFQIDMFTFFGYLPRTEIAGSYDNFIFLFFGQPMYCFPQWVHKIALPNNSVQRFPLSPYSRQHLLFVVF